MSFFYRLRSLLFNLFRSDRVERELAEEMKSQLALLIDEKIASGMSPAEANRAARIEFEGVEQVKERVREVRIGAKIEDLWRDVRYALRMVRKNPGFASIVVVTLALGIGVNTAIFSLVDGILFRPLPYAEPDRLVNVVNSQAQLGLERWNHSPASFAHLRDNAHLLESVAAFSFNGGNLTGDGEPERVQVTAVTADFFQVLGVAPLLGRGFQTGEDTQGNNGVCVLSHGFWQRRFGGDRNVVGRSLNLNGAPVEVIGVMPEGFLFSRPANDMWVPIPLNPTRTAPYSLGVIARLARDVTPIQAEQETTATLWSYARQNPNVSESRIPLDEGSALKTIVTPLKVAMVGRTEKPLLILLGAVGLVLLIACANVANLLLARSTSRVREISVRLALGASRGRVARQLLTESVVLALIGAVVGLILAWFGVGMLEKLPIDGIPRITTVAVDLRVLLFTAGVALITGLLFGLMPALKTYRMGMAAGMHEGGRGTTSRRSNSALVAAQFALAFVLLIGAGLLLKSLQRLQSVPLGFDPDNLITMSISLPARKYSTPERTVIFYEGLSDQLKSLPGISEAGLTTYVPFSGGGNSDNFIVEGRNPAGEDLQTNLLSITPGHLQAMEIPLRYGRDFLATDNRNSQRVAIVDETMAGMFWPEGEAIGKRVQTTGDQEWMTIVGVAGATKASGFDEDLQPHIYSPLAQAPDLNVQLVVKSDASQDATVTAVRSAVAGLDSEIPLYSVRSMNEVIDRTLNSQRLTNLLLTSFSLLALLLASVGIYGTMSLFVASRKTEFGIRLALGARPWMLLRSVLGEGLILILIGVGIGTAASMALTQAISTQLFEVSPTDPTVFSGVALILILVALFACFAPALRSSRVDPMIALRHE